MARDLPYYKMYPKDADSDENFRLMTHEQRGIYWTLLNHSWLNDGIPVDLSDLAELLHMSVDDFERAWMRVGRCFPEKYGRRRNPRQEKERKLATAKSKSASDAVRTRYERSENESPRTRARSGSAYGSGSGSGSEISEPRERDGSDGVRDEFCRRAAAAGVYCQREYRFPYLVLDGVKVGMRADVAVLERHGGPVMCLVECKDYSALGNGPEKWKLTAQYRKYQATGHSFHLCNGMGDIDRIIGEITGKSENPMPPEMLPDGSVNPDWTRAQNVLRNARGRIAAARNPPAYENALLRREFPRTGGMKKAGDILQAVGAGTEQKA